MSVLAFDTLAFAEELKAAGVPETQAKAHAKALSTIASEKLVTQFYLDSRLKELELRIAAEISPIKWGVAVCVAGIMALILKTFFPH